ncbi:MAG: sulfotransferase domain-containing protein [Acetobacteraceae bacterium]
MDHAYDLRVDALDYICWGPAQRGVLLLSIAEVKEACIPKLVADMPERGIGFVTMHKAGSVFVDQVLSQLMVSEGFEHVDLALQAFQMGVREHLYCVAHAHELSRPRCYFGPFRGPYIRKMPGLERLRLVAQVRDPRDCIISLYYSLIYSHPPPAQGPAKEKYERNLAVTQSADLETFVRKQARQYAVRMHVLQDVFQRAQNGILLRYETMVGAPLEWLSALCEFLRIDLSPQIANWVSKEMCTNDLVEDVSRHKRQVFPGDFRRKLTASMQDQLTSMLRPHLDAFGYS